MFHETVKGRLFPFDLDLSLFLQPRRRSGGRKISAKYKGSKAFLSTVILCACVRWLSFSMVSARIARETSRAPSNSSLFLALVTQTHLIVPSVKTRLQ